MAKSDIWMPIYIGDYLADTNHLTSEQHGAYLLMLMTAWKMGGCLPADDAQLASITRLGDAKWKRHKGVLLTFFSVQGDVLVQDRLWKEYQAAEARREAAQENGKRGGRPRKSKAKHNPEETHGFFEGSEKGGFQKPSNKANRNPDPNPQKSSSPSPSPNTYLHQARSCSGEDLSTEWVDDFSEVAQ